MVEKALDHLEFAVEVMVDMSTHQERRCREDKTDFHVRWQSDHKYNLKNCFHTVRFTKRKLIVQVAYTTILGDKLVKQATSTWLPRYGVKIGSQNHRDVRLTGLLVLRTLTKFGFVEISRRTTRLITRSSVPWRQMSDQ